MTKFLLKCFFVTTVLFFGVILGIQLASNNIVQMTGDEKYSTANIVKFDHELANRQVDTEIKKNDEKLTSHDLKSKQEKLEQIETFNLFSQMGAKLSDGLNVVFSKALSKLTSTIGNILT